MKKNLKWLGLGGVLATAMLFVMDLPAMGSSSGSPALTTDYDDLMKSCLSTAKKDCNSWAREGGGSEAPRGLSTDTRVANPFYRIDDAAGAWTKYLGKNVTILATAKYTVFSQGGRTLFEIALTPADQPVIDALQYNQK
jgi:hypothetical protein